MYLLKYAIHTQLNNHQYTLKAKIKQLKKVLIYSYGLPLTLKEMTVRTNASLCQRFT